jgi:hypothetical protein
MQAGCMSDDISIDSRGSITLYLNAGAARETLVHVAYAGRLHVE